MITVQFPDDSFLPGERVGILNPVSSVEVGSDGIPIRRGSDTTRMTYLGEITPVNLERHLDSSAVCQLALARLLQSLTMHRFNLEALVQSGDIQSSSFVFARVAMGWPRREEQLKPLPMAVILPNGETVYSMPNLESNLLDDTLGAYGEHTVLRQTSRATQELEVHVLSAHHEERRAIRAAFETFLLAEPNDDQTGRRQVVPEYYNRTVRCELLGMSDPDDEPRARANEIELIARFKTEVSVVQLVNDPGCLQEPRVVVTSGISVIAASG